MYISFKNKEVEQICNNFNKTKKKFGKTIAKNLFRRLNQIEAIECLEHLIKLKIARCHQLTGDRKGQFAVYLDKKVRLVFEPIFDENNSFSNINLNEIKKIIILEVVDYHG